MIYYRPIKYTCPHCGETHQFKNHNDLTEWQTILVDCGNDEEAGCGAKLAIKVELTPTVTLYTLHEEKS